MNLLLILAIGGVLTLASSVMAATRDGQIAQELLDKIRTQGHGAVVVELRLPPDADEMAIRAAQDRLLTDLASVPHRVTRRYATMPFIALELSDAALQIVAVSPLVVGITKDIMLTPNRPRPPPPQVGPIR
jgi:hypothetical protein